MPFTDVQLLPSVSLEALVYDTQILIPDTSVISLLSTHSGAIFSVLSASWASLIFLYFECASQPLLYLIESQN